MQHEDDFPTPDENNDSDSSLDEDAIELSNPRKRTRGPYNKKDLLASTSSIARSKQERQYVKSLDKLMTKMGRRTRTPAAYFVFQEGRLVANGSCSAMDNFVKDERVQELFKEYIVSSNTDLGFQTTEDRAEMCNNDSRDGTNEGEDDDDGDLTLPANWEALNAIKKRDLVCRIVKWTRCLVCSDLCQKITSFKTKKYGATSMWLEAKRPVWWPSNISFQTPNAKKARHNIFDLDKIIKSFLTFQKKSMLEEIFDDIDSIEENLLSRSQKDDILSYARSTYEKLLSIYEIIDFPKAVIDNFDLNISLNHLIEDPTKAGVYWCDEYDYAELISMSLWNTTKYGKVLKFLGVIYNLTHIESMISFIRENPFGKMFGEGENWEFHDNDELVSKVKESLKTPHTVLHFFGIAHILKINLLWIAGKNKKHIYCEFSGNIYAEFIFMRKSMIVAPIIAFTADPSPCSMNIVCNKLHQDDLSGIMTCKVCLSSYHRDCVGTDDRCGCCKVFENFKYLQVLKNSTMLAKRLEHWKEHLKRRIAHVLQNRVSNTRCCFALEGRKESLHNMNAFYSDVIQTESRLILESFIKEELEKQSMRQLLGEILGSLDEETIIAEILLPEVGNQILLETMGRFSKPIDVERVTRLASQWEST